MRIQLNGRIQTQITVTALDPDTHKIDKLDLNPDQFADDKPK
jgi:hypothetical protein